MSVKRRIGRGGPDRSHERDNSFAGMTQFVLEDKTELAKIAALRERVLALMLDELDGKGDEARGAPGAGRSQARAVVVALDLAVIGFLMMGITPDGAAASVRETIRVRLAEAQERVDAARKAGVQ